jgi:hypothetical protein
MGVLMMSLLRAQILANFTAIFEGRRAVVATLDIAIRHGSGPVGDGGVFRVLPSGISLRIGGMAPDQFFPVNGDVARGLDSDSDLIASQAHNRDPDVVAHDNRFIQLSC